MMMWAIREGDEIGQGRYLVEIQFLSLEAFPKFIWAEAEDGAQVWGSANSETASNLCDSLKVFGVACHPFQVDADLICPIFD